MQRLIFGILIAVLVFGAGQVSARTWYVKPDGTGDAPTIQAGVDSAASYAGFDTVLVSAGTYTAAETRYVGEFNGPTMTANLFLVSDSSGTYRPDSTIVISESGAGSTILDGNNQHRVVICKKVKACELIGFTIRKGSGGTMIQGGGIFCSDKTNILIKDNKIENNKARQGGGIGCRAGIGKKSTITLQDNVIANNTTVGTVVAEGGGIFMMGSTKAWIIDNEICHNQAYTRGGGVRLEVRKAVWIAGNLVVGNVAGTDSTGYGGGLSLSGTGLISLYQNTIDENEAGDHAGAITSGNTQRSFRNNIITNNVADDIGGIHCTAEPDTFACNDFWSNIGGDTSGCGTGENNISENPLFCDYGVDYDLCSNSPCCADSAPEGCGRIGAYGVGCGTCGSPGGCPFLFVWDGSEYLEDNNLLPRTEQSALDPPYVRDYYHLSKRPVPRGGTYWLEIREFENEHGFLDFVEMMVVDHPLATAIAVTPAGNILAYADMVKPLAISSSDANGHLRQIWGQDDGGFFEGCVGDWFELGFGARDAGHFSPVIESDTGYLVVSSNYKNQDQRERDQGISVEIAGQSGWREAGLVQPRANWSEEVVPIDLHNLATEEVRLRLVWAHRHNLDHVAFLRPEPGDVEICTVRPVAAFHSESGDVASALAASDRQFAELIPGQSLRLEFPCPDKSAELARDFILVCDGYYYTMAANVPLEPTGHATGALWLGQARPNPFEVTASIAFSLPLESRARLAVYDIRGREVRVLIDGSLEAGGHEIFWDRSDKLGSSVSPGIYFCRLTCRNASMTTKVIVVDRDN